MLAFERFFLMLNVALVATGSQVDGSVMAIITSIQAREKSVVPKNEIYSRTSRSHVTHHFMRNDRNQKNEKISALFPNRQSNL